MSFRSDLDALEARHSALEAEVSRQTADRDRTRELLEDARARARLPVLNHMTVAAPCNASWEAMSGNDQVRHCAECDKDVYNLSSMTREEAEALIAETNGALCARYYRRADGTVLTADCSVGVRRRRRLRVLAGAGVVAAAVGAAAWFYAHTTGEPRPEVIQGAMEWRVDVPPPAVAPPPPAIEQPMMGKIRIIEPSGGPNAK